MKLKPLGAPQRLTLYIFSFILGLGMITLAFVFTPHAFDAEGRAFTRAVLVAAWIASVALFRLYLYDHDAAGIAELFRRSPKR